MSKIPGVEPVYATIIRLNLLVWKIQDLRFTVEGYENLPLDGGAVLAINHTGYMDFTYAGLPSWLRNHTKVRFMAKKEIWNQPVAAWLMTKMRHIPVNRAEGQTSYNQAVAYLKKGEQVGIFPEATISQSFEVKEFKSGMARMALEANVPIIPIAMWGSQRVWSKGKPRNFSRAHIPISIKVAPPIAPEGSVEELTEKVHKVIKTNVELLQDNYEQPAGAWWLPARLGGSAPTPEEVKARSNKNPAPTKNPAPSNDSAPPNNSTQSSSDSHGDS